jgi:hypothetical protein
MSRVRGGGGGGGRGGGGIGGRRGGGGGGGGGAPQAVRIELWDQAGALSVMPDEMIGSTQLDLPLHSMFTVGRSGVACFFVCSYSYYYYSYYYQMK